jgi:hypothetical protein
MINFLKYLILNPAYYKLSLQKIKIQNSLMELLIDNFSELNVPKDSYI